MLPVRVDDAPAGRPRLDGADMQRVLAAVRAALGDEAADEDGSQIVVVSVTSVDEIDDVLGNLDWLEDEGEFEDVEEQGLDGFLSSFVFRPYGAHR